MEDLPVTVRGYEGGVDIITRVNEPCKIKLEVNDEWYYGKHEYAQLWKEKDSENTLITDRAIHIG